MRRKKQDKRSARNPDSLSASSGGRRLSTNQYYRPKRTYQTTDESKQKRRGDDKGSHSKDASRSSLQFLKKIGLFNGLLITVFIVLGFFATSLNSTPQVTLAETTEQNRYRSQTEYTTEVKNVLMSSLQYRNKLLFSTQAFTEDVRKRLPEVQHVSVGVPLGGRTLSVKLYTYPIVATVASGGDNALLTSDGIIVADGDLSSAERSIEPLRVRFSSPLESFESGQRVFTQNEVELLTLLQSELEGVRISGKPLEVQEVLFNVDDGQLEVSFIDQPFIIKMSIYTDSRRQVGAAKATLNELGEDASLPKEYLDVRVQGRVFVR